MNFQDLSDQQLLDALEKAEMADLVQTSKEWGVIREAMERVVNASKDQLAKIDPRDKEGIMRLQERIALFDEGFLPTLIRNMRNMGEYSYRELYDRKRYEDLWLKITRE